MSIYYAIRHKETGQLMPHAKRGRGYTHWNPPNGVMNEALDSPRLFSTLRKAKKVISIWASLPCAREDYYGETRSGIRVALDGRKKEDLEVVQIHLFIHPLE